MQRILILLFFVASLGVNAQISTEIFIDSRPFRTVVFSDSLELVSSARRQQIEWINEGFLFAGVDSVRSTSLGYQLFFHKGTKEKIRVNEKRNKDVLKEIDQRIASYSNNGYPFASIRLDSFEINKEGIEAKRVVNPGPFIVYDSAFFFHDISTSHSYLYSLLDIVPDEAFSERDYQRLNSKVERSSFLSLNRQPDLSFRGGKAQVYLGLNESTSNSFQGVLGVQQAPSGQTSIVGNVDLDIQNLFRSGKELAFSWERFAEESQRLDLFYLHPFLLESKLSPSFRFKLLKQDTTFITRSATLGAQTFVSAKTELSFSYDRTVGTLLTRDLNTVRQSGLADFSRSLYTLKLASGRKRVFNRLKDVFSWEVGASAGNKEVERNASLPLEFYDTIQTKTNFYQFDGLVKYQKRVFKRQAFFQAISFGSILNDELLNNELYRIGGLNSLRGFNEKELFVKDYLLSRIEFRSYFENESFAYLFYDQLIYQDSQNLDHPFGVGVGFSLATSSGQFSFAMALGKSEAQPVSFSAVKIHFGYISRF